MTSLHWLLLIVVIVVVGAGYLYLRRQNGGDPWQGMDEESGVSDADMEHGVSLNGDSYVGEVRTLTPEDAAARQKQNDAVAADNYDSDAATEPARAGLKRSAGAPKAPENADKPVSAEPTSSTDEPQPEHKPESQPEPSRPSASARVDNIRPAKPPAGEEQIFVLYVSAPEGVYFDGPDIHAALNAEGLKYGLHDLYHRVTDTNTEIQSVYCVANMLNPGVLDPVDQDHLRTPGLAMFLVLPGAIEGGRAMRDMMETANGIAQRLGGQVLDDKRSLLKAQTAQYMLDEIAEIDRRSRLRNTP